MQTVLKPLDIYTLKLTWRHFLNKQRRSKANVNTVTSSQVKKKKNLSFLFK